MTTELKPVPEMSDEGQAAVDADLLLAAEVENGEQPPSWVMRNMPTFVRWFVRYLWAPYCLWWFRLKHRIVMRIRQALGIESDFHIISSHISHHERLIEAYRIDLEAFVDTARKLRQMDRAFYIRTENRLNFYEYNNDQLKHTVKVLRRIRPGLFNEE